jgi:hypothetical protein
VRSAAPSGVDAVFDLVGGSALRTVATLVEDRSRLRSVADKPLVAELGGRDVTRDRSTAVLAGLAHLVASGGLDPHVTGSYAFDEAGTALAAVERGHEVGKAVLRSAEPAAVAQVVARRRGWTVRDEPEGVRPDRHVRRTRPGHGLTSRTTTHFEVGVLESSATESSGISGFVSG